jgi:hypothetical protein
MSFFQYPASKCPISLQDIEKRSGHLLKDVSTFLPRKAGKMRNFLIPKPDRSV